MTEAFNSSKFESIRFIFTKNYSKIFIQFSVCVSILIIIKIFNLINTQNLGCQVYWPGNPYDSYIKCELNEILDLKQEFINLSNILDENKKNVL
jgi:hypothetical protein